jgi:hypothetical protein
MSDPSGMIMPFALFLLASAASTRWLVATMLDTRRPRPGRNPAR